MMKQSTRGLSSINLQWSWRCSRPRPLLPFNLKGSDSVNSALRVVLFLSALFILPNNVLSTPRNYQSNDWDSVSVGQTGLLIRGNRDSIAFKEDTSVMWGGNVIGQCSYQAEYRD